MDNDTLSLWKNRSFILYLIGQSVSAIGDGLYLIAFMWLALELSGGKGIVLGGVFSIYTLNEVVFGFVAGPIADRINKKRLLIFVDILRGLLVAVLFIFVRYGYATVTHLYVLTFCFSLLSPFFHRTEFTIIPHLLSKEILLKGNGVIAGSRRLMQIIAPALGGLIIAVIGTESCFLIDGITYLFSAFCIGFVVIRKVSHTTDALSIKTLIKNMKEGYFILISSALLCTLAIYAAFINFFGGPVLPLLPLISEKIELGSSGYGIMMSVLSAGLIVSSFIIGFFERIFSKVRLILIGLSLSSLSILLIGIWPTAFVVIGSMFLLGVGLNISNLPIITLFQVNVDTAKIGVVSSFVFTIAQIAQPISIALTGFLADHIPLSILFFVIGIILLIGTLVGFLLPQFRTDTIPVAAVE
jgi:DHA3 family macrolide efflux protein-like MFS transporter